MFRTNIVMWNTSKQIKKLLWLCFTKKFKDDKLTRDAD